MSNKPLILIGIITGVWLALSGGTLFMLLFALLIFLTLLRFVPEKDRPFMLKVASLAFILRFALMLLYYYFHLGLGRVDILGPDGEAYSQHGWYISRLLLDQNLYLIPNSAENIFNVNSYRGLVVFFKHGFPEHFYQVGIFTYLISMLFALFDYNPFMIKLINSLFSILTGMMVYFTGKEIFNSKIGKISMVALIFLPSMFIYSITALKDSILIFLIVAVIWGVVKFQKAPNWFWPFLILISLVAVRFIRPIIILPLSIVIVSALFLRLPVGIFKKSIIAVLSLILLSCIPQVRREVKHYLDPNVFFSMHLGFVNTPGNNYKIFPERCYYSSQLTEIGPLEVAGGFVKGAFHMLFEPLPQRVDSVSLVFAFFQTILFFLFMPFVIIGLVIGLRYRTLLMAPLTIYLIIFIALMSVNEGNVGTVFRHRDMLMPFFIILGVAGCYAKLRGDVSAVLK